MTFFSSPLDALKNALLRSGRVRARQELLRLSPRTLEDAGFSRELLESGVQAWPWRLENDSRATTPTTSEQALRQAERELQSLSDRELDDLALARVDIPRAVREGRVGIDAPGRKDDDLPVAA